ncbi:Oidioi.mRNA.OKI2018_I69.chr1.g1131.t1.cds [Oikopleura dioica]|uniref:Oidioi.mRNA.OKI2018_I69.chr1.g1131.t1.cds n=1 Tax=Oikopleura dioica TaxID=34765 RepID=A0ABN7SM02_OIKDI|nr:Oidioi.mRNA.OKI2018_I69.chr1.g1131.t1.cds [Oikopleura dioica]
MTKQTTAAKRTNLAKSLARASAKLAAASRMLSQPAEAPEVGRGKMSFFGGKKKGEQQPQPQRQQQRQQENQRTYQEAQPQRVPLAPPAPKYPTRAPNGVNFVDVDADQLSYCIDGASIFEDNLRFLRLTQANTVLERAAFAKEMCDILDAEETQEHRLVNDLRAERVKILIRSANGRVLDICGRNF